MRFKIEKSAVCFLFGGLKTCGNNAILIVSSDKNCEFGQNLKLKIKKKKVRKYVDF